jgi:hypothetical protein
MNRACIITALLASAVLAGCEDSLNVDYTQPDQQTRGMIYILPGIQGVDQHYKDIRDGLVGAGIKCAIKIHPWGCRIPGINLYINETDTRDNRQWGETIAAEIAEYRKKYPGRRVCIIGQSGGAAIAVFTAEAMSRDPDAEPLDGLILLDASISADYDLTDALIACEEGILNFYNPSDVVLLGFGTKMIGNLDGGHGDSAGRTGFSRSYSDLYQIEIVKGMVDDFSDPHFADCTKAFASQYIAPWIIDPSWPLATHVPAAAAP